MEKLMELRARAEELIAKMRAMLDKADTETRDLTDDETAEYASMEAESDKLDREIKRLEKLEEREAAVAAKDDKPYKVTMKKRNDRPKEFRSFGEFIYSIRFDLNDPRLQDCEYREFPPETREQSMGTGTEGGFAVPEQFRPELLQVQPQEAIFEPRATVIPAGDPPDAKISMPSLDQTSAKNIYGGVVMYKIGETTTLTESSLALKEVNLEPAGIGGYVITSDKLLRNWQASGPLIGNQLRKALIGFKDTQFYNGDGVDGPLGVLQSQARVDVNRTTASQIVDDDIRNMMKVMKMGGSYVWIASQTTMAYLLALADGGSNFIFHSDYTKPIPNTLMGIPLIFFDRSVALGTKGDLILVDLSYYLIKKGSGPFVAASEHVYFTSNRTVIKITDNVDGKPWLTAKLPLEGATTNYVSPFVVLN